MLASSPSNRVTHAERRADSSGASPGTVGEVLDLLVLIAVAIVVALILGRRRLPGLGRGAGSAVREYRRARAGLPPADPELRERDEAPLRSRR